MKHFGTGIIGKTLKMEKERDKWLTEHPHKKCVIFDPKDSTRHETRWFEPHKQIEEKK